MPDQREVIKRPLLAEASDDYDYWVASGCPDEMKGQVLRTYRQALANSIRMDRRLGTAFGSIHRASGRVARERIAELGGKPSRT